MNTLLAAYAVAWALVSAYMLWLAAGNGRLTRRLERLETLLGEQQIKEPPRAKVA
jgi:CcmD family protein